MGKVMKKEVQTIDCRLPYDYIIKKTTRALSKRYRCKMVEE
jgi:hypothetical protein